MFSLKNPAISIVAYLEVSRLTMVTKLVFPHECGKKKSKS